MTSVTVGGHGEIPLPPEVRNRYGLVPNRCVRVVETRSGILLIPLSPGRSSQELEQELADWQALGADAMARTPFGPDEP